MSSIETKSSTGVEGLDDILGGGLPRACMYLVQGDPGVGKTTLAMQFLLQGARDGERCLYITLSETKRELEAVAASHHWDLAGIELIELSAVQNALAGKGRATLFQPTEIELGELSKLLMERVRASKPDRVVIDSLSELKLMTQSALRFRRQILQFKQEFAEAGCTVLLLDDQTVVHDTDVNSIVHGVVTLESAPLKYGIFRRFMSVKKLRGVRFREGNHDYVIRRGGVVVFPRLVASEHYVNFGKELAKSGNAAMDALVGGGLHYGTSNLLIGPAGAGKSTVAMMYAHAAASRGDHVLYHVFDETTQTLLTRARDMGIAFEPLVDSGRIILEQVDPAEIAPGELAHRIRERVQGDVRVVVFDSLNGYVNAMPQEDYLHLHLHELLTYLNQQGVLSLMILAQHGLIGPMGAPVDVSYLADTLVVFRYFEAAGEVKKAVCVIKKRSGPHELSVRELSLTSNGIVVGPALTEFQGVLTGVPTLLGGGERGGLLKK